LIGVPHILAVEKEARGDVSGEIVDRVEKDLRSELMSSVRKNPKLRGAWVVQLKVDHDKTTGIVTGCTIEVMVDKDTAVAKRQRTEIDRIAKTFLKDYPYRVTEIAQLPVDSLLVKLRAIVDLTPKLTGTEIVDASFSDATLDQDGRWQLYLDLSGQVAKNEHRTIVTDLANRLFEDELPGALVRVKALADSLQVVQKKNATAVGNVAFSSGVQSFAAKDYATAYQLFTQAARAAPERVEIHYWRVAALIGSKREQEASTLLGNLIKQRKSAKMESDALRSLERVQGPIRQRMADLERDLLSGKPPAAPPR
jgi:hypothetical protein